MELPKRIFLDTSVVNFMVDYGDHIFDKVAVPDRFKDRIYDDIRAITQIFYYADHNAIEMVVTHTTFQEIEATADLRKREALANFYSGLREYGLELIGDDYRFPGVEVQYYEQYLMDKGLNYLKDANDRRLLIEALFYKCDIFCTRDYHTILKHRLHLQKAIPLEILTPTEWCNRYSNIRAY
jgi:predicted nucleic acid-binding protein